MSDLHMPNQGLPTDKQPISAADLARRVEEIVGLPSYDEAERLTRAVVGLLCGRLSRGEVEDMAADIPDIVGAICSLGTDDRPAHRLNRQGFLRAVADTAGTDLETARLATLAVFKEMRHLLTREEFEDIGGQLPHDLKVIWSPASYRSGEHEPRHRP